MFQNVQIILVESDCAKYHLFRLSNENLSPLFTNSLQYLSRISTGNIVKTTSAKQSEIWSEKISLSYIYFIQT